MQVESAPDAATGPKEQETRSGPEAPGSSESTPCFPLWWARRPSIRKEAPTTEPKYAKVGGGPESRSGGVGCPRRRIFLSPIFALYHFPIAGRGFRRGSDPGREELSTRAVAAARPTGPSGGSERALAVLRRFASESGDFTHAAHFTRQGHFSRFMGRYVP